LYLIAAFATVLGEIKFIYKAQIIDFNFVARSTKMHQKCNTHKIPIFFRDGAVPQTLPPFHIVHPEMKPMATRLLSVAVNVS